MLRVCRGARLPVDAQDTQDAQDTCSVAPVKACVEGRTICLSCAVKFIINISMF